MLRNAEIWNLRKPQILTLTNPNILAGIGHEKAMEGQVLIQSEAPDTQAETGANRLPNGQFAPGVSGNRRGRPKGVRYLSEAFRFWLAAANELNPESTNADEVAAIVGEAALSGDMAAVKIIFDRTEGKVREWPNYRRDLGEDDARLKIEQERYYRMEDEGLNYDEVVELEDRELEEERQEKERAMNATIRRMKREAKEEAREKEQKEKERKAAEAQRSAENLLKLVEAERARQAKESEVSETRQEEKAAPEPDQPNPWSTWERPPEKPQPKPKSRSMSDGAPTISSLYSPHNPWRDD